MSSISPSELRAERQADRTQPAPFEPMEARAADELPEGPGWQYEPKWDGFRCLAVRDGDDVALFAKSGKPLHRYFPEVVEAVRSLGGKRLILDGELVIPVGNSLSFEALQLRLHPAESRIRRLAKETPATLIVFDLLVHPNGDVLLDRPLEKRRIALDLFIETAQQAAGIAVSPFTRKLSEAQDWLARAGGALDGVVAKRLDAPYQPGERAMVKVKHIRSADCVVGGFRYGTHSRQVGSLLLGLFNDDGKLNHVGFTSTISVAERQDLTERLESLGDGPGFTGNAPGGPSRWSTERSGEYEPLRHELVVEVAYDHVSGGRFRHGTKLLRWRPDKAPAQCTLDQLQPEAAPARIIRELFPER